MVPVQFAVALAGCLMLSFVSTARAQSQVRIDATALTPQEIQVSGERASTSTSVLSLSLSPGNYEIRSGEASRRRFAFEVDGDGNFAYGADLDEFLRGRGTSELTILGHQVVVDATALAPQDTALFDISPFPRATPTSFVLLPGTYQFFGAGGARTQFFFEVTTAGAVQYGSDLDDFLGGRGTSTLDVSGFTIEFDATSLAPQPMQVLFIGAFPQSTATEISGLLPGRYEVHGAAGARTRFFVEVTTEGLLQYDAALDEFLAGRGSSTLTISGFDITMDASALVPQATQLIPFGAFPQSIATSFEDVLPGRYELIAGGPPLNRIFFEIDTKGRLRYADELEGMLSGKGSTTLTVNGHPLVIDARALTAQDMTLVGRATFSSTTTTSIGRVLPGAYELQGGRGSDTLLQFEVSTGGGVAYTFDLDEVLAGRGTGTLVVNGFEIVMDVRELDRKEPSVPAYQLPGITGSRPTDSLDTVTVLPGSYRFQAGIPSFPFEIDGDGNLERLPPLFDTLVVSGNGTKEFVIGGVREIKLVPTNPLVKHKFGSAVAIAGDTIATAALPRPTSDSPSMRLHIIQRDGSEWAETLDVIFNDGVITPSVSVSGQTVVAGGASRTSTSSRVRVWRGLGSTWTSDGWWGHDTPFGRSVGITGNVFVVGLPDTWDYVQPPSVFAFERAAGAWPDVYSAAVLSATDFGNGSDSGAQLGTSVAIAGTTIVAGAPRDGHAGEDAGAAYVFERDAQGWAQVAKLTAPNAAEGDRFGEAVSISGDTLVVGAPHPNWTAGSGSAYVYVRSAGSWIYQSTLGPGIDSPGLDFGDAVSVSGDMIVVGAPGGISRGIEGTAYVFVRRGSQWSLRTLLAASDGFSNNLFGTSVSVSGDRVVVGAPYVNAVTSSTVLYDQGAVYVYELLNTATGSGIPVTLVDTETGERPVELEFDGDVLSGGTTTLSTSTSGPPTPDGFYFDGSYYDISTTALFTGEIQVCIAYDGPGNPRMFHYGGDPPFFEDVTSPVQDKPGFVCGVVTSLSPFVLLEDSITVGVDVMPGSGTNPVNRKSNGKTPVAILGSANFDVRSVDPSTVTVAGAAVALKSKGRLMSSIEDVDRDGYADLSLHVFTREMLLGAESEFADVEGRCFDGTPIGGRDSVRVSK